MSESKTVDFLGGYLRELNKPAEPLNKEPVSAIVRELDIEAEKSVEDVRAATGVDYLELVPTLRTLNSVGLVKMTDENHISLTKDGALFKLREFG